MKKLAIFLAIMLIPFSAFALDTISDNDLSDVTGQAGVSIYTNSIQIVKTGITTTYIDYDDTNYSGSTVQSADSNEFSIVTNQATTKIFFKGVDPLMIDIVNMYTLDAMLGTFGMVCDATDYGQTAVMIVLPNAIEIRNFGDLKTYYTGTVTARNQLANNGDNEMIAIKTTGGTTTIQHADMTWANGTEVQAVGEDSTNFYSADLGHADYDANAVWKNSGATAIGVDNTGTHTDQIAILITSHEDQ